MDRFTEIIRRYSPQEVMEQLYGLSLRMLENDNKGFIHIPVHVLYKKRGVTKDEMILPVWKISEIVYWSIVKSNDYRNKKLYFSDALKIIDEFYGFDNERVDNHFLADAKFDEISQFLFGMMGEQEQFQNLQWIINSFNRNYHILIGSKDIKRNVNNSFEYIIQKELGVDVHTLCKILISLTGVCLKTQEPLVYEGIESIGIKQSDFSKVINYYAVNYDEIRNSKLGIQIFYTKPFVKTENPKKILAVTYHQVVFLVANGLYWGIRNYYYKLESQDFVNAFGGMFEDYLLELSAYYLKPNEFKRFKHKNRKVADFRYEFEDCIILVEQKSALLKLNSKSQAPNMKNINTFLVRNIVEAYDQIEETSRRETGSKPILKFILLYENVQNTQLIQMSMPEIFQEDSNYFVIGIAEFEQILRMRKEDLQLWKKLIEQLLSNKKDNVSITHILDNLEGYNYLNIFTGEHDYFQKYINEMRSFIKVQY